MRPTSIAILIVAALGLAVRGERQWIEGRNVGKGAPAHAATVSPGSESGTEAPVVSPDTTGEALWTYLQRNHYRSWPLWPGKGRFFEGEQPHGALLTTYVDSLVYEALADNADRMPARSIIVKENFGRDSTLKGHTVMYKVPGYDPENHDWFWGQYAADGKVIAAGRVELCYACHRVAAEYDDLWILRDQKYGKRQRAGGR